MNYFSSSATSDNNENKEFVPSFTINYIDNPKEISKAYIGEISRSGPRRWGCKDKEIHELNNIQEKTEYDVKHPFYAKIQQSRQLFNQCYDISHISDSINKYDSSLLNSKYCTRESGLLKISRECIHLDIDISGSNITYTAGDHVALYPANDDVMVKIKIKNYSLKKFN